jgi:hypothetical protein
VTREIASKSGRQRGSLASSLKVKRVRSRVHQSDRNIVQGVNKTNRASRYSLPSKTCVCRGGLRPFEELERNKGQRVVELA